MRNLDKTGASLEILCNKPSTQLAQQAQDWMTIMWRGIAIYISGYIKLGRFKQLRKVMRKEECIFVTGYHVPDV
jgi:hypothetical protein